MRKGFSSRIKCQIFDSHFNTKIIKTFELEVIIFPDYIKTEFVTQFLVICQFGYYFHFHFHFKKDINEKFIKVRRLWKELFNFVSRVFLFKYVKSNFFFFCLQFSLVCLSSLIFWMFSFFSDHWSLKLCVSEMKIVKREWLYFIWIQLKENIRKNHLLTMSRGRTTWV